MHIHNQMATQSLLLPMLGHINLSVTFVGPPTHTHTQKYLHSTNPHRGRDTHFPLHTKHTQKLTSYFFLCWSTPAIWAFARKQESSSDKKQVYWRGITMSVLAVQSYCGAAKAGNVKHLFAGVSDGWLFPSQM